MVQKQTDLALEALRQAIRLEQDGRQFYLEAAERTTDPRGAEMFRSLAKDEEAHLSLVKRQYESLTRDEGWIALTEAPEKPLDLETPLFPPQREDLEKAIKAEASDIDALFFALDIEVKSRSLYIKAAKETTDPAGEAMYEYLADAELSHFEILMLNYDNLVSVGRWLGLQEG